MVLTLNPATEFGARFRWSSLSCAVRQNAAARAGAEVEAIEGRAQINEERICDRAGEDPDVGSAVIALQVIDALRGQGVVVRHGAGAHVAGNRDQRAAGRVRQRRYCGDP